MAADTIWALRSLYRRINEKEQSLGIFDLCVIDQAILEIEGHRKREAVLEVQLQKNAFEIKELQTKGSENG